MTIQSLVDNETRSACEAEHGLSLLVTLASGFRVLFDMGHGTCFAENASRLGIDLSGVDLAVISHGHHDHGGGLETFLQRNTQAPVYVHRRAFEPHFSLKTNGLKSISLDGALQGHPRLVWCDGLTCITSDMLLFGDVPEHFPRPEANRTLLGPDRQPDDFAHEQSLLLRENGRWVLLAGCAHAGAVNILEKAERIVGQSVSLMIGGMHLKTAMDGLSDAPDRRPGLQRLADALLQHTGCTFCTMHCTGMDAYRALKACMGDRMRYLGCGEIITFD